MKVICIGRNYADHVAELKNEKPTDPVVFMKPDTSVLTNDDPFYYPDFSKNIHYEAELVLRISKNAKYIEPDFAFDYISAVTVGIDFTARDIQKNLKEKGLPWLKAKGFDGAAPVGKFLTFSKEEIEQLTFTLSKNGKQVQEGTPSQMMFSIPEMLNHISTYVSLRQGDLLFTGTPSGVGPIAKGDRFEGFINGEQVLRCDIK